MNYSDVISLPIADFFNYVQNIKYGYADNLGNLHFANDADFKNYSYAYSPPADVVKNNCGWCWDVCQLIKNYCKANHRDCKTVYFEYFDKESAFHQTHTQCYMKIKDEWFECPDNSSKEKFGQIKSESLEKLISDFSILFFDYCHKLFGELSEKNKLVKVFDIEFPKGISDEKLMSDIRSFNCNKSVIDK